MGQTRIMENGLMQTGRQGTTNTPNSVQFEIRYLVIIVMGWEK